MSKKFKEFFDQHKKDQEQKDKYNFVKGLRPVKIFEWYLLFHYSDINFAEIVFSDEEIVWPGANDLVSQYCLRLFVSDKKTGIGAMTFEYCVTNFEDFFPAIKQDLEKFRENGYKPFKKDF